MPAPASTPDTNADPARAAATDQYDAGQEPLDRHELDQYDDLGLPTRSERIRILLFAAVGPLVAGYLALAALLALAVALAPGSSISTDGILAATGPTWLAAMHVQLIISGHPLGMLPLLPTALVLWLTARAAMTAADRIGARTPASSRSIFLAIGVGNGAFAVLLSSVGSGNQVSSSPVLAFFLAALMACVGVAIGLSRRCGLASAVLARADEPTRAGVRAGLFGLVGLVAAGAVLLALALLLSWPRVAGMFRADAPGFGAGLGIFLLSLAYLPNALIGALSFAVGPGFSIGAMVVRPLAFHPGPVLGLPLLGALPVRSAPWWVVAFLLPAAVGVGVGWTSRRVTDPVRARSRRGSATGARPDRALGRLRAVGVAALTVAVGCLVLAALAGGTVADGPFNPVTVQAGLLALTAFGWIGIVGTVTALVAGQHPDALVMLATRMADALTDPDDDEDEPGTDATEDQAETSDETPSAEADPDQYDAEDHAQDWIETEQYDEDEEKDGTGPIEQDITDEHDAAAEIKSDAADAKSDAADARSESADTPPVGE
jgi:hypothetical protein